LGKSEVSNEAFVLLQSKVLEEGWSPMNKFFSLVVMVFLYLPLLWFTNSVARDRNFFDLSIMEMIISTAFALLPLYILILLDKNSGKNED
jgi:hypothetical protein